MSSLRTKVAPFKEGDEVKINEKSRAHETIKDELRGKTLVVTGISWVCKCNLFEGVKNGVCRGCGANADQLISFGEERFFHHSFFEMVKRK